jgi:uncharacterized protein (UPF0276 family)
MNEQSISGAGIGLRSQHIHQALDEKPDIPWFEILADNHLAKGGLIPMQLAAVRECYPVTFHCVGMSLAGSDPLDMEYLARIKQLADQFQPAWISDHLCFTRFGEHQLHDLLPFPYTEEALVQVAERVLKIQDYLNRALVIENVSSYVSFKESSMDEADFLSELVKLTDCELLLDVNNAYVNEINHGISAEDFINRIPLGQVREIHLAGYEDKGGYLIDAHNNKVADPVWKIYEYLINQAGERPTLIEWDNDIPSLEVLMQEAAHAEQVIKKVVEHRALRQAV